MNDIAGVAIRPYAREDATALWEAVRESIPEISPWMPWCHAQYAIEDPQSYLDTQVANFREGNEFAFAIVPGNGRYLGGSGLNLIDRIHKRANLGCWVRSSAMRRGVATSAVGLLRDWGFRQTDLVRLELVIAVGNDASHRVAHKSGAEFEGTLRRRLMIHDVSHDASMLSFTRGD